MAITPEMMFSCPERVKEYYEMIDKTVEFMLKDCQRKYTLALYKRDWFAVTPDTLLEMKDEN